MNAALDYDWRNAVFYQIYPRSFLDTTGNGVGDLKGITKKLDYIADLGVDGIWISPFFKSPMKDYGYDVSDYRDVDPLFGTLGDFDTLIEKAHSLGLKIIIDLVFSHTSDQHPWFSDPAKKNWYVWADAKEDGSPPNNWVAVFGGSAWEWSAQHEQYYLHNFLIQQPDLNFHNPEVQEEALDIMRFWLDRGVDAFRLDVVNFFFHDQLLRDNPPRPKELGTATQFEGDDPYSHQQHIYDKSRPENLEFLSRMRAVMDEYENRFTIGEIGDDHPYQMAAEYTAGNNRLHTTYNPQMMSGAQKKLTADIIRTPIEEFAKQTLIHKGGHPAWAFSNHDVVRAASRWLANSDGFSQNPQCSKMLNALLLCLSGTLFLYQGEELGLPEAKLTFEQLQDPWGIHLWPKWQGRDGCRTPMPWTKDIARNQWLPVPDTHLELNAQDQSKNPESTLNFTRDFIKWRKSQPALTHGEIHFEDTGNPAQLTFTRSHKNQSLHCSFDLQNYTYNIKEI